MRFLVAWDGSELSTLALRVAIHVFSRQGDQLLVYHVTNRGRHEASPELELEALQQRLASELSGAQGLRVLRQRCGGGEIQEVPTAGAGSERLLTVHEKEAAEATKISQRIVEFAAVADADVLVMGSTGVKGDASASYQRTMLGSSAHLAALVAPCSVVLVRQGCKVDPKLATVYMVAVDGSQHALHAMRLSAEWARPDKDEIVCRVFGPADFTATVEETCTNWLQQLMHTKKVEYAVIPTELAESADVLGDELSETARMCRFRQQAFLVFGARGRGADDEASPSNANGDSKPTTLGHVARWCILEAQCSLIIARTRGACGLDRAPLVEEEQELSGGAGDSTA
mmetsp:Transcript_79054/g.239818  ORF Transcript_79054/g.239818 Transcript_79054/m.239818 type:complete len:343 (+) Transcript_79054:68-1096(+)